MKRYDVVIIGAGPAGLGLAYPLKATGLAVAVVEENLWGGTCPNRGCDPKKVLLSAVEAKMQSQYLVGNGIQTTPEIDWQALMQFEKSFTKPVSKSSRQGLIDAGIDVFDGHAEFSDAHTLDVAGTPIKSERFVIATGQRPSRLTKIKNETVMQTSTDFLQMDQLPKQLALVGGGYIAFELAIIAQVTGAEVHIIHHNDRPLKQFPKSYVDMFMKQLERMGVRFHLNVDLSTIEVQDSKLVLKDADDFELTVDQAFVTAGRQPNIDTLNLAGVGVQVDRAGIIVDDHLQTSVPNILAMGDVVAKSQPKLTPVAGFEARYLAQSLTGKTQDEIKYPVIPTLVYGMPQLAQVGVSLKQAQADPSRYEIKTNDMTDWFTYRRRQEPKAQVSVIREKASTKIVGAVVMSSEAEVLINQLATIINQGGTTATIKNQIWAYPSQASDLGYL
jgi:glutathione reductase (NADPH)